MSIVAIIPARGGSKSIPDKNIKALAGKPLIAHSIERALACKEIDRVIVSTDSKRIAEIAKEYKADIITRPAELAMDTTPMLPVLQHAVLELGKENYDVEVVVLLDPTSPFRSVMDIENCIKKLKQTDADSVVTVCEVEHNPYFVMVELRDDNMYPLLKTEKPITRRQDTPRVYRINAGVYAIKRETLMEKNKIFTDNTKAVIMPQERSAHIDHEMDFEFAEFLAKKGKSDL